MTFETWYMIANMVANVGTALLILWLGTKINRRGR